MFLLIKIKTLIFFWVSKEDKFEDKLDNSRGDSLYMKEKN